MTEHDIVYGDKWLRVSLPERTQVLSSGFSTALSPTPDLAATIEGALRRPLDGPPLRDLVTSASRVTVAFDDPTVPCFAPVWNVGLNLVIAELEGAGVARDNIELVCANSLHRQFTHDELARTIGDDLVTAHGDRLRCHDAEDPERIVELGNTASGYRVQLNRCVVDSDLLIYLNCSTVRGFSGGWKSVCVGLSGYPSIRHHHTPDIMSMSFDRNRMHEMLDEMGSVVDAQLGPRRVFKIETVLANPLQVHDVFAGSVGATRERTMTTLKSKQVARRDLVDEPVDVVVYGVPEWSPYAAFSHTNPILDLISTGLGYLGGVIQAVGKPGCTVVLATPARKRWDRVHHPSYEEVWRDVLPVTKDPDDARRRFEGELATRADYIDKYRHGFGFHPVHGIMALYPLKRLRHAGRVIVAGADDPAVPRHCGFEATSTVERALSVAEDFHGPGASVALVEYPMAVNRA